MATRSIADGTTSRGKGAPTLIPSGEQTVWVDVSPLLKSACEDLQEGELIHGENFNLFAAMSALEIMDPKMDSGIVCKYYSVDEAIDSGAAPLPLSSDRTCEVQRTIDIMDHLLACEATWHRGQSLAQTVFSCIYLLKPERTSSYPLLHSYCRVVRASCRTVISVVSDARTHEEEDIFTMSHGLCLSEDGDEKCLSMMNAVEETVSRQLRACKAASVRKRSSDDLEPLQANPDLEDGFCKAILCRLRFRKHFYHLLVSMRRPQGRGFELARKHIASCLSELDLISKSSDFLQSCSQTCCRDGRDCRTTASGCQPIGFDATLNGRLSTPTPPRSIETLSWGKVDLEISIAEINSTLLFRCYVTFLLSFLFGAVIFSCQAVEYFQKLLHDLDIICSYSLDPVLEGVLRFVVHFQKSQPDLVARSHLQVLLVQDGKLYGRDLMWSVISRSAALPQLPQSHDIQNNEYILQLGQLVINMLKILCTNAAWQRHKLGKILQDWRVIYVQLEWSFQKDFGETSGVPGDENLGIKVANHILLWVEEQTYWIALRFLVLGFELDLYSPSEYCMVYWYMYAIYIKFAEKLHLKFLASNDTIKRKGKKKKDPSKDVAKDYQIPPAVLFLQCHICLAEGLAMMIAALRNEHKVLQIQGPFNTEEERFIQHFELLLKACVPDQVSYLTFLESTMHARFATLVMYNYFKDAQRIAKELKGSYSNDPDKLAELRRLELVAEHNSIALNVICRLGALDTLLNVSFEFSHHPYFATAVVKRS